jgi:hypothetical protein
MSTKHGAIHLVLQYISGEEKWRVICCCGNTEVHYTAQESVLLRDVIRRTAYRERCVGVNTC